MTSPLSDMPVETYVSVREAISAGLRGHLLEVTPATRISKTPTDTLAKLNTPCETCGHSFASHSIGGDGKMCMHCTPKGSQHSFHEGADLSPHLVNAPSEGMNQTHPVMSKVKEAALPDSTVDNTEASLIRLQEMIFPDMSVEHQSLINDGAQKKNKAVRSRGNLYNSHSLAAHRSSVQAYNSGTEADHEVAAAHHEHASQAASDAMALHTSGSRTHKDYSAAKAHHDAQAKAHKTAATTAQRGHSYNKYDAQLSSASSFY